MMLLNAVIVPADAGSGMDVFLRGGFRSPVRNHVKQINRPFTCAERLGSAPPQMGCGFSTKSHYNELPLKSSCSEVFLIVLLVLFQRISFAATMNVKLFARN